MITYETEYGLVTISKPYYSVNLLKNVVQLTLIKSENKLNGWGISLELPVIPEKLTTDMCNTFAQTAHELA